MPSKPMRESLLDAKGEEGGLRRLMAGYLEWMQVRNFTEASVEGRERSLFNFALWCEERSLARPREVTKPVLERYQRWLFHYRKKNGRPLGVSTQHQRLVAVKSFFKWLTRQNHLPYNPASELELPKAERRLPQILTVEEVSRVLAGPDVGTPTGLRDRAMVEVLWATGIRRMEVAGLTVFSIDAERGTLMVRQGKGRKDRMVPIAQRAIRWVEKYLADARPLLVVEPDAGVLFVSNSGEAFGLEHLSMVVRKYIEEAGIKKPGACHLFRHTMATQMLEGGADVRYIQQLLGHADLKSTALYTQVSIRKLSEVYAETHPAAKLGRPGADERAEDDASAAGDASAASKSALTVPAVTPEYGAANAPDTKAELLSSLAAEAAEEEQDEPS